MFLIKKIIFFSLCLFLFLPAITRAAVTCCACTLISNPVTFAGFACTQGDHTCNATCSSRSSSWTTYQPEGSDPIFAKGETVTCCQCTNVTYKMCVAENQTCSTICGSHGFDEASGTWLRGTTETPVGSGETQGTKTGETPQESSTGIAPIEVQKPNIELPIPGFLGFSEVKVSDGGYLDIPWIAEYFTAIFNWLLAIVGAVATVMIMVGGFQYLIASGDRGRIAKAKERITNALIGLFLALGSYLILYVINPDLTNFKNIRLSIVQRLETNHEGAGTGTYTLPTDEDIATESSSSPTGSASAPPSSQPRVSQYCRFIAPPTVFQIPRADLQLDRVNIRGENESRCPGGTIYTREMVDAVLAAQRSTGIPAGFLLAQAQHETRGFRASVESGQIPEQLWGRKCGAGGTDVYKQARTDCNLRRQPSAESALRTACEAAGCRVLSTIEPCNASTGENVPAWACFTTTSGRGGFTGAAMEQATFYRDRIGRTCSHCGSLDQFEGSVMGFAARMSCSLTGGFQNSKWDNSLYAIIRQNCLEDSRNTSLITLSATLGPDRGASTGGVNARDPSLCADPYDSGKIANPSAAWCASAR